MNTYGFEQSEVRTWLEIDTRKLRHNYQEFRKLIGKKCLLLAIVKSNAYGHGLIGYSQALDKIGVDWFGVDSFVEARKLREAGIKKPILVLGYTLPGNFNEAINNGISITISNLEQLHTLSKFFSGVISNESEKSHGRKDPHALLDPPTGGLAMAQDDNNGGLRLSIHFKIDTGMHRQGFQLDELPEALKVLNSMKNIMLEGVYSHFADVEPSKYTNAKKQLEKFNQATDTITLNLNRTPHLRGASGGLMKHMAATAGTIALPASHFNMVRVGIGLMGLWPSESIKNSYENKFKLEPIMSWKTVISEIKSVKKYEGIGYGFTETLRRDSRIAILPIGYWHGFRRALSSKGEVLIHGIRCKVLGRVSMDMTIVDVTDLKIVRAGDTVILIGRDRSKEITVEEMAMLADSYSYEIITTINPLIQKIYK